MTLIWLSRKYHDYNRSTVFYTDRGGARWNADLSTTTMDYRASEFPNRPKPSLAFGLKVGRNTVSSSMLNDATLRLLEESAYINLHARPSPGSMSYFAYPCLVHEVKKGTESPEFVENQLAKSLVFALEQQAELLILACESIDNQLPVFGLISIGTEVKLYCAFYQNIRDIVSRSSPIVQKPKTFGMKYIWNTLEQFELRSPPQACAFVLLLRQLQDWIKTEYTPFIKSLIRSIERICDEEKFGRGTSSENRLAEK